MEGLNVSSKYTVQQNSQEVLPMDIVISDASAGQNQQVIQEIIITQLEDNLGFIAYNAEDLHRLSLVGSNPAEADSKSIKFLPNNIHFTVNTEVQEPTNKSKEALVIRNTQQEPAVHHAPSVVQISNPSSEISPVICVKSEPFEPDATTFSCFKCKEQFGSITLFRQHLKWHKAEKKFICSKCSMGFNEETNLLIHVITNHNINSNVCPICKILFQRKASLKSHILLHQVEELFLCEECNGEFQNDDELLKHMETHAMTKISKSLSDLMICPHCKSDFKNLDDYKSHVAKHVEVKKNVLKGRRVRKRRAKERDKTGYGCRFCGKNFPKISSLERHERIHTGEKPYKCSFCNKAFAQKGTMLIHSDQHTGTKRYSCTLCPSKFSQKGNLRAHVAKTHTAPKNGRKVFKCSHCACIFTKLATLNGHVTKVHVNQSEDQLSDSENLIDKVMDSLKALNSELGKSALKTNEVKPAIKSPAPSDTSMVKLAEHHVSGNVRRYMMRQKKIGDIRYYFCNYCPSRFKKPSDLIRHFRTHTMEKPFKCSKCNQAFSLKSSLTNHNKIHQKLVRECNNCDTSFRNSRNLNAHVRNHHKDKIPFYICVLCKEVFFTFEEGKQHRFKHEDEIQNNQNIIEPILKQPLYQTTYGPLTVKFPKAKVPNTGTESALERPHHCKICDARFTRLMSLRRHMLYHAGERKFKCNLCPKAFITKYRLKEHQNYHRNIKNFGCQTCGKKFVTSSLMKRHTLIHNTTKNYCCPYCSKPFRTVLLCRAHIKTVHQMSAAEEEKQKSLLANQNNNKSSEDVFAMKIDTNHNDNIPTEMKIPESSCTSLSSGSILQEKPNQVNPPILKVTALTESSPQDLQPGYRMVYLDLTDINLAGSEDAFNGNTLIPSFKIHNESYFVNELNDLQDSTILFNIDSSKTNMVNPNEVIKATSSNPTSQDFVPPELEEPRQLVNEEGFSNIAGPVISSVTTLDELQNNTEHNPNFTGMEGVPIRIIDSPESTALTAGLVNGEMIPYDAPVICINCHKMFSDYTTFEKHTCTNDQSVEPRGDIKILLQDGVNNGNMNEKILDSNIIFPAAVEINERNSYHSSDSYENKEMIILDTPNPKLDLEKMKKFTFKKPLLDNIKKLEQPKKFSCKHCNFSTSFEDRFRKHLVFHPVFSDKLCKYCFKEFKKHSDLKRHLRTHTGERPFECEKCHKKFTLKSTLDSHLKTHNVPGVAQIICDVCNSSFSSKSSLKVHMLLHTGVRPHACNFCEQTFRTSAIRKSHEKSTHLSKNEQSPAKKLGGAKLIKCIAEEVADNVRKEAGISQATSTEDVLHNDLSQTALLINAGTDDASFDRMFIQIPNSGFVITPGEEGSIPINLDNISLLDVIDNPESYVIGSDVRDQPSDHISEVQNNPKPSKVECDICHKMYASKDVLRKHKKALHGQNKKFPCIKCDKGYDRLDHLQQHIAKLHTGSRPYACQYCSNSFSEENGLKTHIKRIHQKSSVGQETANAILNLQYDLTAPIKFI